jgi:hypothetical protein
MAFPISSKVENQESNLSFFDKINHTCNYADMLCMFFHNLGQQLDDQAQRYLWGYETTSN